MSWRSHEDTEGPVHVWPEDDVVDHDIDSLDECVCGPTVAFLDNDGTAFVQPLVSHHSLDGRERNE